MWALVLIAIGLVALSYGADWLVTGAARLATSFGVSALVIGLTLVAFGTSMPELLVSVTAAWQGVTDIALGNVVGSNIANIGLILGLTGFFFPLAVHSRVLKRELPLMIIVSLLAFALAWDRVVSRLDGLILVTGLILFTLFAYLQETRGGEASRVVEEMEAFEEQEGLAPEKRINRLLESGRLLLGIVLLAIGAQWLVSGASSLARAIGISEWLIGVTLVAFGTSLPELATSLVSAYRGQDDISVGNIVGSNIFNLLAVLGITSVFRDIPVGAGMLRLEFPVMIAFSVILIPLLLDSRLDRWQGALLFAGYIFFTIYLLAG